LLIAKMLLLNYHPDLRCGRESVLALMFNMNELWEEFIYRRLKYLERHYNWKVTGQKSLKYWKGDSGTKKLIPDIVIHQLDSGKNIVLDTKWKRPVDNKPDDHDLRQLLIYKLYFEGYNAYLLYPCSVIETNTVKGLYTNEVYKKGGAVFKEDFGLHGGLLFVNILVDKKLINRRAFIDNCVDLLCEETF
jgi:5-methylcytosine-specific restriction endonuclease McrBC regulatory subunit McrC